MSGLLTALLLCRPGGLRAQSPADTLDVVNWNLEWFCDGSTLDAGRQIAGARTIMNGINADVYALCEIVNVDSLASLTASLQGGYSYVISTFGSFADNPASFDYPGAQKLALVYRTSMLRNLSAGPLLKGSPNAYYNFSSGRFPYRVNAEVIGKDGVWRKVTFIVLHAKASSDYSSCQRRSWGAIELRDSLNRYLPHDNFLLLGDFNDDLNTSICPGSNGISNYLPLLSDSADFKALTLPLSKAGAHSIDGFSSLIDHVFASNEMYRYYVSGSAASLELYVKSIYPDYKYRVSDHFPIKTQYVLDPIMRTAVNDLTTANEISVHPVPADGVLQVEGSNMRRILLVAVDGRVVADMELSNGSKATIPVGGIPGGLYQLRVLSGDGVSNSAKLVLIRH